MYKRQRERSKLSEHIKRMGLIEKKVDEFIDLAYEKIPNDAFFYCSNCGWTVSMKGDGSKKCIDNRCREKTNNFEDLEELEMCIRDRSRSLFRLFISAIK